MQLCWNTKKSRGLVTFCCLRFSFSSCSTLSWDFSQLSPPSKPCNVGGPTWFCNTRLLEAQQGGFGSENFPKYDLTSRNSRYNQHESIQSKFVFASSIFFIFSHWDSDDGVSNGMENMNKVMMGNCTGLPMGRELDSCNFMRSNSHGGATHEGGLAAELHGELVIWNCEIPFDKSPMSFFGNFRWTLWHGVNDFVESIWIVQYSMLRSCWPVICVTMCLFLRIEVYS